MDLATIQEIYNNYKLYYVINNGAFFSINDIISKKLVENPKIISPSLHIVGTMDKAEEFLEKLGYENDMMFIDDVSLGPFLNEEIRKFNEITADYTEFKFMDPMRNDQTSRIINNLTKSYRRSTMKTRFSIRKLDNFPSELECSNILLKYPYFSLPGMRRKRIMEYLMEQSPTFIANVLAFLGIDKINASIDIFYGLASHLNVNDSRIIHSIEDVSYISSLTLDQLITIISRVTSEFDTYYYFKLFPWSHASLLYMALTGNFIFISKDYNKREIDQYLSLIPLESYKIAALCMHFFPPMNLDCYKFIAGKEWGQLVQIIISSQIEDIDKIIDVYEIIPPPQITSQIEKFYYFANALRSYQNVLVREPGTELPGRESLIGLDIDDAEQILYTYTDKELLAIYPINYIWNSRRNLVEIIFEVYRGPVWRLTIKDCKNDNTMNVIEGEIHGLMNKNDDLDPTFSYGEYENYRCYQASELTESFREDKTGFHFTVPDWIDPRFDIEHIGAEIKEFPSKSMVQLLYLIEENFILGDRDRNVLALRDQIYLVLNKFDLVREELSHVIEIYKSFPENEKYWATLYLIWLFLFSMWMRFWKGPGYPFPHKTRSEEYCIPTIRDEHVVLQLFIRDEILEQGGSQVEQWASDLSLIEFDWKNKINVRIKGKGSLNETILNIQRGSLCQGIAGDILSSTAYSLIKHVFNYDTIELNQLINEWIPPLQELEKNFILRQLPVLKQQILKNPSSERSKLIIKTFTQRLNDIYRFQTENLRQQTFDPDQMEYTQHTD